MIPCLFILLFGEAVLESDNAVKGVFVLGVLAEVTNTNELELFTRLCVLEARLNAASLKLDEGIGIEVVVVGLVLGNIIDVLNGEELVVKHQCRFLGVLCGEPMNGALDLSSINGIAVFGFEIGSAMQLLDRAVIVLDDLVATNDIRAHQANLAIGLHTEELGRRNLCKIVRIDIDLTGKCNLASAGIGILKE